MPRTCQLFLVTDVETIPGTAPGNLSVVREWNIPELPPGAGVQEFPCILGTTGTLLGSNPDRRSADPHHRRTVPAPLAVLFPSDIASAAATLSEPRPPYRPTRPAQPPCALRNPTDWQ